MRAQLPRACASEQPHSDPAKIVAPLQQLPGLTLRVAAPHEGGPGDGCEHAVLRAPGAQKTSWSVSPTEGKCPSPTLNQGRSVDDRVFGKSAGNDM